jgi:kynurenine formamidase
MLLVFIILTCLVEISSCAPSSSIVDLTHTIQANIPLFPSLTGFNFTDRIAKWTNNVNNDLAYFYATNTFTTSEHTGTHIDAPYHFSSTGWKVDEIPLEHLVSIPARIIDVSKQCEHNRNYLITRHDVEMNDLSISQVQENRDDKARFVLLFYTGWTKYWPNQQMYAGNHSTLSFPGLSEDLAHYLIDQYENQLVGIGIDTLSSE